MLFLRPSDDRQKAQNRVRERPALQMDHVAVINSGGETTGDC